MASYVWVVEARDTRRMSHPWVPLAEVSLTREKALRRLSVLRDSLPKDTFRLARYTRESEKSHG